MKALSIIVAFGFILHGLVHLMDTVTYTRLGTVQGLAYKTTLLGGRWAPGRREIAVHGIFWAVAAIGFVIAAIALLANWGWYRPVNPLKLIDI